LARLSDRGRGESLHHVEGDEWVSKPLEGPRGLAWGGRAAPQGQHARFFGAITEALTRGGGRLVADPSGREPACDTALTDMAHRMAVTGPGGGPMGIGPGGPVGIHLEHDVGVLDFRGRSHPTPGQLYERLSFVVCEAHTRGLVHIDSSIPPQAGSWRYRHESITAKNENERVLVLRTAQRG
jgi:hypothetical protein